MSGFQLKVFDDKCDIDLRLAVCSVKQKLCFRTLLRNPEAVIQFPDAVAALHSVFGRSKPVGSLLSGFIDIGKNILRFGLLQSVDFVIKHSRPQKCRLTLYSGQILPHI